MKYGMRRCSNNLYEYTMKPHSDHLENISKLLPNSDPISENCSINLDFEQFQHKIFLSSMMGKNQFSKFSYRLPTIRLPVLTTLKLK